MTCPICLLPHPLNIVPDGIWYDPAGVPVAISYRCTCGTNRSIPWADATHGQRIEAQLAQLTRDSKSEMKGRV